MGLRKTKIESVTKLRKEKKQLSQDGGKNKESENLERNPFIIRAGYGGTVPTKYRKPSKNEEEKLLNRDIKESLKLLQKKEVLDSEEIIELVKIITIKKEFNYVKDILNMLGKFLQLTPYVVDTLIKHEEIIDINIKSHIKEYFVDRLNTVG